ncbi:MAG: tyrosine-type recombinase/integrase [Bacteroidales bacterium]|nr:tyrosine-type recombinase/integrase [Bacteroidales bacterium]
MLNSYLEYLSAVRRYSQRTVRIYSEVLKEYFDFNPLPCDDPDCFTISRLRNYEVYLLDTKKEGARTVSLHLSVLSGYCRFLMKKGILASNPVRLVSRPKVQKRLPEFYREQSMQEYFYSTDDVMLSGDYDARLSRMIISTLYNTGIRRSELISLNIGSVDFERRVMHVRGKGDKSREIPLLPSFCEELLLYLQLSGIDLSSAPDAPLLRTPKGGRLYPVFVDRVIKRELAAVDGITVRKSPHVLRHTLATELLDEGADLNSIKELLGHSSLAATQVYTHNSIEKLRKVYNNAHPRAKNENKNGD